MLGLSAKARGAEVKAYFILLFIYKISFVKGSNVRFLGFLLPLGDVFPID
jgi:hypothetical protein